jgi:hypothetical protein
MSLATADRASDGDRIGPIYWVLAGAFALVLALALLTMGRLPWCACGTIKLWHGDVFSSESSQQLTDWYTFSHIVHGLLFYAVLWLVGRRWPLGIRFLIAMGVEVSWEVLENTDYVINRYREDTAALNYYGDSVINSVGDYLAAMLGFFLAARLPLRATLVAALLLETVPAFVIRDNLTLNVIMLIHPVDAIRDWQLTGMQPPHS